MKKYPYDAVLIDSCAFDPKCNPEDRAALEIFKLGEKESLFVGIAHSTEKEIDHLNTPLWVKQKALELIFTVEVNLNANERKKLFQIEQVLGGNGKIENIKSDARHIFEAQKYGSHFVTMDRRILDKAGRLEKLCSMRVCKPSEFIAYLSQKLETY